MPNAPKLHQAVARWYRANARDLPWRGTRDPYAILVSEVMLQQTQVDRVIPKYLAFIETFPSFAILAEAQPADVIRIWAGMGYNGRAVRLHRLAREVVERHGGRLPETVEELRTLPGVGPYTAAAVACFAFGATVPVLDTNVYRVLSRVAHGVDAPSRREIDPLAAGLTPRNGGVSSSEWHQGLMDIGATVCMAARPRCMLCPLRELCAAAPTLQAGADRRLAEASVPYSPKQSKFEGSTRYYRGRIVDFLRSRSDDGGAPIDEVAALVEGAPADLADLLTALERDGLVVRIAGRVRLP